MADEVSKLADRSATSTKEIGDLIKDTLKLVKDGVELAVGSGKYMEEIVTGAQGAFDKVTGVSSAIEQQITAINEVAKSVETINEMSQSISAATEEQTTNSKQVSKAIENVNKITQQAASAAEEMASSTEELSSMAQQLQGLVAQFKVDESNIGRDAKALPGPSGKQEKGVKEVTEIKLKEEKAA